MIQSWLSEYLMSTISWRVIHVNISVTSECNSTFHNINDDYTYVTNNAVMKTTTATTAMVMIVYVVVDIPALVEVESVIIEVVFISLGYCNLPKV